MKPCCCCCHYLQEVNQHAILESRRKKIEQISVEGSTYLAKILGHIRSWWRHFANHIWVGQTKLVSAKSSTEKNDWLESSGRL
jgi:hypothetical protein